MVSELGTWLGEQVLASGKLPDQEAVQGEIRRLVEAFFAQEHEDGAGAGVGTGADTSSGTITAAIATPGERPCVLRP